MDTTRIYILCGIIVLGSILMLFKFIFNIQKQGKKELLKEMYKNNDINKDVYFKYLAKENE